MDGLQAALSAIVGPDGVLCDPVELAAYAYDVYLVQAPPQAVVFPPSAEQVAAVVRLARARGLPVVARGAGTGLSGGAVPIRGGIVVATSRLNRILSIDLANRVAVVEPGLINLELTRAVAPDGYFFAPDPASQRASTIGGNVAENAGGPHCLAHGVTTNHVLGLEVVLADGEIVWLGSLTGDRPGYDLVGAMVGSEGTLGIVTKVAVRLMRRPEAVHTFLAIFDTIDQASETVSAIIAAGIIPTALEMIDQLTLRAVEAAVHAGYPEDAGAVLLIEIEGLADGVAEEAAAVEAICRTRGVRALQMAAAEEQRELLWRGRKGAAGALGRIAPNYYIQDGAVPRSKLPMAMAKVQEIGRRWSLPISNVFHAGDGNLHPTILFDVREPGILERVIAAGEEILRVCVEAGGTISGEHGIGLEKQEYMPLIYSEADLATMLRLKQALDPSDLFNPGKVFPRGAGVGGQGSGAEV
ncbi:MAG: FAD-binding protein [Chloroflexi bacterium]|nr:FAD-binding protein [Chloroflexota bacterium]